MKIKKLLCSILTGALVLCVLLGTLSCGDGGTVPRPISARVESIAPYEYYPDIKYYFDTPSFVYDYTGNDTDEEFRRVVGIVESELGRYHKLFDTHAEYLDEGICSLATVNRLATQGPITVDSAIIDLLEFCIDMYYLTDGRVNVAFGAITSLWYDYREGLSDEPTYQQLCAANEHTDIGSIVINREMSTVEITDPDCLIDVGAIAKGYATEMIAGTLCELGYTSYVLDIGGNLRMIGTKGNGESWVTGIRDPDNTSTYITTLTAKDTSVVTSGTYERGLHIIDTQTLYPCEKYLSVSIVTKHGGLADALSTAVFTMDIEDIRSLINSLDGVEVILVTSTREIIKIGEPS